MDNKQLTEEILALKKQVASLQSELNQSKRFQDDFSAKQIIRRPVQYLGKVYRADGTLVTTINP